ncbi:hypothetical protein ACOJVU_02550 [Mycobacterium sp. THU-M104]|uniref:hypothetical protein n=1 Tax=Mycobacterium sp. THU-M104 TaxID=3410515 RepID=UPI003B9D747A
MSDPGVDAFEKLVARLTYPMFVVTTAADGVTADCLVGFAGQTSIHPPRFLVNLSTRNHTFRVDGCAPHDLESWVCWGDVRDLQPGHEA